MEKGKKIDFSSFVQRSFLSEQTALVDYLLKNDPESIIKDDIDLLNYSRYEAKLSDGLFVGTFDELTQRKIRVEDRLEVLQNELNQSRSGNAVLPLSASALEKELNRLEEDLNRLEKPHYLAREVLEWWLIPYWLSKKLEEMEGVILRAWGCSWWGRTCFLTIQEDDLILQIWILLTR